MSRLLLVIAAVLMLGAGLKTPVQPMPVTRNDPASIDRQIKEIYHRFDAYLDTLPMVQYGKKFLRDADSTVMLPEKFADTSYRITLGISFGLGTSLTNDGTFPYVKSKTDSSFVARFLISSSNTAWVEWIAVGRRKR